MRRFHRIAWSSVDQGLASISNLLLSVLAAAWATPNAFGAFAVSFTIYQFGLGASRAFIGEPTLIRVSSPVDGLPSPRGAAGTLGAASAIGFIGSAANLIALMFFGQYGEVFITMAVGFPLLMMADSARYWEFAHNRSRSAAVLDLTWLVAQLLLFGLVLVSVGASLFAVISTWIAGSAFLLLVFVLSRRVLPSIVEGVHWTVQNRDLSFRFFGEYLAISGVQQSIVYFSVIFAGVAAAGAIRGAQVITGPLSVLTMGVAVVALPALVRRARDEKRVKILTMSIGISFALMICTAAYGLLLLLLPSSLGELLLGETWIDAQPLVGLVLVQLAISNLSYGATAGLRALERAKLSLRLRLFTVPASLAAVILGAWSGGAAGALVGGIIGGSIQLVSWWVAYGIVVRARPKSDR